MFMYIDVTEDSNSIRLNVRMSCHLGTMLQRHDMTLLLYTLIPYSNTSDHSVTVGIVNNMLFVGAPSSVTLWSIFIQRWRSFL